jgi:hypothetical protein
MKIYLVTNQNSIISFAINSVQRRPFLLGEESIRHNNLLLLLGINNYHVKEDGKLSRLERLA